MGKTPNEAIWNGKLIMLSDDAQLDLGKAVGFLGHKFPLLRKLRPSSAACIDVVYSPNEIELLKAELIILLDEGKLGKRRVTVLLQQELSDLLSILERALNERMFVAAHLE